MRVECKYCNKKLNDFIEKNLEMCLNCARKETNKRYNQFMKDHDKKIKTG